MQSSNSAAYEKQIRVNFSSFDLKPYQAGIISLAILAFLLYFGLPVLSWRFLSLIPNLGLVLLPFVFVRKAQKPIVYVYVILGLLFLILSISFSGLFRAKSYRGMIGDIRQEQFSDLVSPIKMDQVPIIDQALAASLAEKKLGEDFALGSRVNLGTPTIQMVKGKLYWVVPLLHSGFFKWLANTKNGTPGYIMVSATNSQDITFVRELNGKTINVIYQRSAFFNQDLKRHLYLNGYTGIAMAGDTFELDDNGEPHWTITVYNHNIGVRAPEALGLATIHAGTGKISYYPLTKTEQGFDDKLIPAWVDRVQPSYFVIPQLNWWGKYVRGFWNTIFGKRDMLSTTEGFNVIYGNDGRSYFYTGMSSVGSDEGTVGFVLCDTRNKRTALYMVSGATEYAAMRSAQGKVQQFKYYATFPILVNLNGLPTYFMTLKDAAGLVKMYCFVSVKDYSLVGVGESLKAARESYQMILASANIGTSADGGVEMVKAEGIISRIAMDIKDGRSYYYFSLQEDEGHIFVATSNLSSFLPLSKAGDPVHLEYIKTTEREINITSYKNRALED